MRPLLGILRLLWRAEPRAMRRGAALSVLVMLMGVALLALAGWFITATGLAGLAGIGIAFDIFRPSAGVRALSLGRAAARYGERLTTHDATLRALAHLRVTLLARLERFPLAELRRMRGATALTRITADVDALDGVLLRLALPVVAAAITHAVVFAGLWLLSSPVIAISVAAGYLPGGALVLWRVGRSTFGPSSRAEEAMQRLRRQSIGLFRGRREAVLQGTLPALRATIDATEAEARSALDRLDRLDSGAGMALACVVALVVAAVLAVSGVLVNAGLLLPAPAAIGVFAALALAETLLPLRRGIAEIGRMRDAATRVLAEPTVPAMARAAGTDTAEAAAPLVVAGLSVARPGRRLPLLRDLSFEVAAGETLALRGPSGSGKSTLLDVLAGISRGTAGGVRLLGRPLERWEEGALRDVLTLVPQRAALIGGSVLDNLRLGDPDLDEAAAERILRVVALDTALAGRGGPLTPLGEGGQGLSGGQARRLVLARALLRRPAVLMLDEPTEGLDAETSVQVLENMRNFLPSTAIVTASHRAAELASADRVLRLEDHIPEN
ncbi:amino acid ABC transporter ATP-binding/permease protein [Salipiger sp.]|uniref:amino acid ABC transporter ATP-binding/permease protein n=1 Tax=Salipiger sp. TaxID=2078585 RepID=UPI003A9712D6